MRALGLAFLLAGLMACSQATQAQRAGAVTSTTSAPTRGAVCIDRDGDGYGLACLKGPDADDDDPKISTYESARKEYPDLRDLLKRRGYRPDRIFFLDPDKGNDRQAKADDIDRPYQSWDKLAGELKPGDLAIFRPGTYPSRYALGCYHLRGTAQKPITLLAMPGEKVVLEASSECVSVKQCEYLVLDGFILAGGPQGCGITLYNASHLKFCNIEAYGAGLGLKAMQDLHDITMEGCVFHDSANSHGMYFGSRDQPNSDIVVRDCLLYGNAKNGFQHNGRVTGLVIERCQFHSNGLAGISFLEGVSKSVVRDNLIFNNYKQGIVIDLYDDTPRSGIEAYDQTDNLIEGNIIWVGQFAPDGSKSPSDHAAILVNDSTTAQNRAMSAIVRNNILVTFNGPVLRFADERFAKAFRVEGNALHGSSGKMMQIDEKLLDAKEFTNWTTAKDNDLAAPTFKDVKLEYFDKPEKFDFSAAPNKSSR